MQTRAEAFTLVDILIIQMIIIIIPANVCQVFNICLTLFKVPYMYEISFHFIFTTALKVDIVYY